MDGDDEPERRQGIRQRNAAVRIAYLVHNLADPAVGKRVRMLTARGDQVLPVGFHRDARPVDDVAGVAAIDLGRTFDADFAQRLPMVLKRGLLPAWAEPIRDCDVIIARNLEMLAIAALVRWRYGLRAGLVYECLDIHRLLLSHGIAGVWARAVERALLRKTNLLIVSSPAFLREYFEPRYGMHQPRRPAVLLVENKLLPISSVEPEVPPTDFRPAGPPWRIGWFGMIRCQKSLDLLCEIAARHPGLVQVTIRGRPSRTEFADFDAQIARTPGVSFGGTYHPSELASLYGNIHFAWAIDYFEEGANSRWLLPNRIYEGGAYGAVPIALAHTETARWLDGHGIGVCLEDARALEEFLRRLTPAQYRALNQASAAAPRNAFLADRRDCSRLLAALQQISRRRPTPYGSVSQSREAVQVFSGTGRGRLRSKRP
jgi:hypothetical protein